MGGGKGEAEWGKQSGELGLWVKEIEMDKRDASVSFQGYAASSTNTLGLDLWHPDAKRTNQYYDLCLLWQLVTAHRKEIQWCWIKSGGRTQVASLRQGCNWGLLCICAPPKEHFRAVTETYSRLWGQEKIWGFQLGQGVRVLMQSTPMDSGQLQAMQSQMKQ